MAAKQNEWADLLTLGNLVSQVITDTPVVAPMRSTAASKDLKTFVIDRHGAKMRVQFDMITDRNEDLCNNEKYGHKLEAIECPLITSEVVGRFASGMSTRQLDSETAAICINYSTRHSDYEWLAARIYVSDLHKRTPTGLKEMLHTIRDAAPNPESFRMSGELLAVVEKHTTAIDAAICPERDYRLRFFGFQTLARNYLIRPSGRRSESSLLDTQIMERPQHLYMRVALGVFMSQTMEETVKLDGLGPDERSAHELARLKAAFEFYEALSLQRVSNATPTMLNAGTNVPQLSSCFQVATGDDLETLADTIKDVMLISKWSGGVSIWLHSVRAEGAPIRKTGGKSSGIKRYIKILNEVQLYVDQGGNRPGAFAVYLSVDHDDIYTFLAMARLKGEEALKGLNAPDLKFALWVPDLFMEALRAQIRNEKRVAEGGENDPTAGDWHLFSPDEAPDLHLVYGQNYRNLYAKYVREGKFRRRVKAGSIIAEAFKTWTQVGTPYVLYKDAINLKSNMMNIGPIESGNLCTEVIQPSWSDFDAQTFSQFHKDNTAGETAVCNLAAICLEAFVQKDGSFDLYGVIKAAALETTVLNRVIDLNYYPSAECRRSNRRHRAIGIGLMGLADVLARQKIPYGSQKARNLARAIAAAIYYGAISRSIEISKELGPYDSFEGSPISKGLLQPDLWVQQGHLAANWEEELDVISGGVLTPAMWAQLRLDAAKYGVRNAYVTAYMPTATTSNIVGVNECFEPFTSNIYTRTTLAGEFFVVNRHLMAELSELGLWDDAMRRTIIAANGSVQGITRIPIEIRRRYRTAREIHPSNIIRMAAAMAPWIDQSMSMNAFFTTPDLPKILRFLFEGWEAGLKTGMYYCHTAPAAGSQKTSIMTPEASSFDGHVETAAETCSRLNKAACTSCVL
jgi:ribonucleoside-diphosphate reductase alpha subunit